MIHELTHVWQYQQQGSPYLADAVFAQATGDGVGDSGYNYGYRRAGRADGHHPEGLRRGGTETGAGGELHGRGRRRTTSRADAPRPGHGLNPEMQAQVIMHWYVRKVLLGPDATPRSRPGSRTSTSSARRDTVDAGAGHTRVLRRRPCIRRGPRPAPRPLGAGRVAAAPVDRAGMPDADALATAARRSAAVLVVGPRNARRARCFRSRCQRRTAGWCPRRGCPRTSAADLPAFAVSAARVHARSRHPAGPAAPSRCSASGTRASTGSPSGSCGSPENDDRGRWYAAPRRPTTCDRDDLADRSAGGPASRSTSATAARSAGSGTRAPAHPPLRGAADTRQAAHRLAHLPDGQPPPHGALLRGGAAAAGRRRRHARRRRADAAHRQRPLGAAHRPERHRTAETIGDLVAASRPARPQRRDVPAARRSHRPPPRRRRVLTPPALNHHPR